MVPQKPLRSEDKRGKYTNESKNFSSPRFLEEKNFLAVDADIGDIFKMLEILLKC